MVVLASDIKAFLNFVFCNFDHYARLVCILSICGNVFLKRSEVQSGGTAHVPFLPELYLAKYVSEGKLFKWNTATGPHSVTVSFIKPINT